MSVTLGLITVMRMLNVPTQMEVLTVCAMMATWVMEQCALVSTYTSENRTIIILSKLKGSNLVLCTCFAYAQCMDGTYSYCIY